MVSVGRKSASGLLSCTPKRSFTVEHVENNTSVRDMLGQRGIKPEDLPASEDIKKLERRVKREEKKLAEQSGKLTNE